MNGYSVVFAIDPVVFWLWGHSLTGGPYTEARSHHEWAPVGPLD
jgi:hypothetical protein